MIKIYSLYDGWLLTDITPLVKQAQWSGSITQPARKFTFSMAYSITDDNQPRIQIGPGSLIKVIDVDSSQEIFRGEIIDRTLDSSGQQETFTVVDYLRFFMQSKSSMNIKDTQPEDVALNVCDNFSFMGITPDSIASTGIAIKRLCSQISFYNILMECYTQASLQNGKKYIPLMWGDKFNMLEKGQLVKDFTLQSLKTDPYNNNVLGMTYKDSIEKMVNKIQILDKDGNFIDSVEQTAALNTYGLLQDTLQKDDNNDPYTQAYNKLIGFYYEISADAIGNTNCITGYAIPVKIWYMDVLADTTLYINEDTHTWDCGSNKYTMHLTLSFDNTMDLQGVN